MIIDGNELFKTKRAINGDKKAMVEMSDYYSLIKYDQVKSCKFLEMLVENEPSECERLMVEISTGELPYEDILRLIAWNYLEDQNDKASAIKWFQKHFDYIDFKFSDLSDSEREKIKQKCRMYQILKDEGLLDNNDNRFWLQWEREYFKNSPNK